MFHSQHHSHPSSCSTLTFLPWLSLSRSNSNITLQIQVYIINNKPGDFPEFDELRAKYKEVPELVFLENTEKQEDRFASMEDPDDFNNPNDIPGKKVRGLESEGRMRVGRD